MDFNVKILTEDARYSDILQRLLEKLGGKEVLRLKYESYYSGFVDIDVALIDGKVLSYFYNYGSCLGCDEWENKGLTDNQIQGVMQQEATFFDSVEQYQKWLELKNSM
jgi:hypothetical protein